MSFKKQLLKLEDEEMPLLGPNVKSMKFYGLILSESRSQNIVYFLFLMILLFAMILGWIDLWFVKSDVQRLLTNIMFTLVTSQTSFKMLMVIYTQNKWREIIQYVTKADILSRNDSDEVCQAIVKSYTTYSRKFTYTYWLVVHGVLLSIIVQIPFPLVMYYSSENFRESVRNGSMEMTHTISLWIPFHLHHNIVGFIFRALYELTVAIYSNGITVSFDSIVIVTMVFIRGELKLLRRVGSRMFDDRDRAVIKRNVVEYRRRQEELIRYTELLNECISPIMFVYLLLSSVFICCCVYQMTIEPSVSQKLTKLHFPIYGVTQLFIYCWHGNNVTYQSDDPMLGLYESAWWKNLFYRKEMMILMMQSDKIITFTAGPTFTLTMETFINILKGAYSYHTLSVNSIN